MRTVLSALLVLSLSGAVARAAEETGGADFSRAAANEDLARRVLFSDLTEWDAEKGRRLAGMLPDLSDEVAAEVVWMAASASKRVDMAPFFAAALAVPSPVVRSQAAAVLALSGTSDNLRMLLARLAAETDPAVSSFIIGAVASRRPMAMAVRNLMDVMLLPALKPEAVAATGDHLRRLTRTKIPDNPSSWRDWWLDNSHFYQ